MEGKSNPEGDEIFDLVYYIMNRLFGLKPDDVDKMSYETIERWIHWFKREKWIQNKGGFSGLEELESLI